MVLAIRCYARFASSGFNSSASHAVTRAPTSHFHSSARPLVFADTPFLSGITLVSEARLLSSGQSRVLGGYQQEPSRLFRFRVSPEQSVQ